MAPKPLKETKILAVVIVLTVSALAVAGIAGVSRSTVASSRRNISANADP